MKNKTKQGLTIKKEKFSEWFSQIIEKAELVDIRNNVKGFLVIRPWGAEIIENMYDLFENELKAKGHKPTFMPSVIPKKNLKKESSHIQGFSPEVFWLKDIGGEKLALRPTSETLYTPMFKLWIRSHRDLPLKLYQRGSVFRLDTKATRPLIRTREILWIEAHDAFASKKEAEAQVQEDIEITEKILHQKLGIPFFPMKRPSWDKFAGAEYTIGSDVIMPDGKLIQQPSSHMMGQKFSKAFGAVFKNEQGKKEYLWTTAYGPAMSRILVSIISQHGDNKGLILPFNLSPIQIILIPIYTNTNKNKIISECNKIKNKLKTFNLKAEIDLSEKTPGEKFNIWELKGVPFRLEIGEKEVKAKKLTIFIRNINKKISLAIKNINKIKDLGKDYDKLLKNNADSFIKGKIINCQNKNQIKKVVKEGKIARINFCSLNSKGEQCAEIIEKEVKAEIRGSLANKNEKPFGNCAICGKKANIIAYIGKSY